MSDNNFLAIKILEMFSGIIRKWGINFDVAKTILVYKFLMSKRTLPSFSRTSQIDRVTKVFVIIIELVLGFIPAIFILIDAPIFVKLSLNIAILMFLLISTIISDISWFILDIAEKNIILSKPVDDKTYSFAKNYFIVVMIFSKTIRVFIPSLILVLFKYNIVFFIVLVLIYFLLVIFSYCICHLLYAGILVYFDGEKLKDVIVSFQIVFMIIATAAYQLAGRIVQIIGSVHFGKVQYFWVYLLPSSWFAAVFEVLFGKNKNSVYIVLSVFSIVITLAVLLLQIFYTGKILEKNLVKLNSGEVEVKPKIYKIGFLTNLFLRNGIQRASYIFAKAQLKRDRTLKSIIYPTIATFLVVVIAPAIQFIFDKSDHQKYFNIQFFFLYSMYAFIIGVISTLPAIQITSNKNASWIYNAMPIENPFDIKKGAYLAFVFTIVVRLFILLSIGMFIFLRNSLIDYLIIFFVLIFFSTLMFPLATAKMPFSLDIKERGTGKKGSGLTYLMYIAIGIGLGFVHGWLPKEYKPIFLAGLILLDTILWILTFEMSGLFKSIDNSVAKQTYKRL